MAYQRLGNRPPMILIDSDVDFDFDFDFEKWTVDFMDFISRRENGDLMIQSFSEGPLVLYKREEDFTDEESKRKRADKDALHYLLHVIPQHLYIHVASYRYNPMFLWNGLTKLMLGSKVDFRAKKEKKAEEVNTSQKISDVHKENSSKVEEKEIDFQNIEEKEEMKDVVEDSEKIIELSKRLSDIESLIEEERKDHKKEKEGLVQRISDLEKALKMKDKDCEDIKVFELKFQELSKQNSDFQKVLLLEKEKLEKERVDFEVQRKGFEAKNEKLNQKITELHKEMDKESEELEKMKKADFQVKNDFSVERKIFQQEIQKLTKNLAGLSTDIMKEKRVNCDIRKKLELMTKERNALKDKVRSFNNSECFSECPMRPSNIFYKHSVDKSSKSFADLPSYKRVNMKWKVKGKFPEKDVPKSSFPNKNFKTKVNSFVNSYCGNYDFVNNNSVQYWYGTYHFPSYRAPLNVSGPKTRWVPKST